MAIIKAVQSLTITNIFSPSCKQSFPCCCRLAVTYTYIVSPVGHNLAVLSIWIEAEPNATIIAASIPVLRVLFRDAQKYMSSNSAGARYHLESHTQKGSRGGFPSHVDTKSNAKTTITNQDHSSETSILSKKVDFEGGIKQTREVVVDYDDRTDYYGQSVELRTMSKKV